MNRAELLFLAIDTICHPLQNYIRVPGIEERDNVSYDSRYPACKTDIYYKKSTEKLPVLINIHGGGFVKGDKKHRRSLCKMYADRGWFVLNTNYRLSPEYPFPASIEDMAVLINKLPQYAEEYNLDLSRLVVTGDSAGAYMATYICAAAFDKDLRAQLNIPDFAVKPTGLLSFCGPYDTLAALKIKLPFGIIKCIAESITGMKLNKDFFNVTEYKYIKELSPTNFVNKDWCPTMLTFAKKDIFCAGQGEILFQKLKDNGVECREKHSTKFIDNHCYHFNFWTKTSKDTMAEAFKFLEERRG